ISAVTWWKIFDNLRRSLVPSAMLLVLLTSWLVWPAMTAASLILVLTVVMLPTLAATMTELLRKPTDLPVALHIRATLESMAQPLAHSLLTCVFLPYEAYISADAIVRTLTRMSWTKRRLLEWKTASESDRSADGGLLSTLRSMAIAPMLAIATLTAI